MDWRKASPTLMYQVNALNVTIIETNILRITEMAVGVGRAMTWFRSGRTATESTRLVV